MKIKRFLLLCGTAMLALVATTRGANYDESKIPKYTLPNPLEGVASKEDWPGRRAEILKLFEDDMFGKAPAFDKKDLKIELGSELIPILDGKAIIEQPVLTFAGCTVRLLIIRPAKGPSPAFLAYNFSGNHTVLDHEKIALTESWMRKKTNNKASASDRGSSSKRWAVEKIINSGFALVTVYYGDVDPDFHDGYKNGVHAAFGVPKEDEWASIAGWAWGLSRILDFLETHPVIDAKRVAVLGHSRLGKTSLWAGATDERFALVISNNSGCGGAALSRREFGETVKRINTSFPHWFCDNYKKYNDDVNAMPFDQHMLIALSAPRPVYVASAEDDRWADPHGEFLSALHASPVYKLLGTAGLPASEMPKVNKPVHGQIGYHIRTGKHDVTDFDWEQYLKFATKHLK